jgi:protein TonB
MRTFLFSAALAIVFHALLFSLGAGSPQKKVLCPPNKAPLSISIDYVKPSVNSAPLSAKPQNPGKHPEALRRKTEKSLAPVKPMLQKLAVTKKAQTPSQPKERVRQDASFAGLPSFDSAPGMTDAGFGSQLEDGGAPSQQTGGGSLTTASLPPAKVREAFPVYRSNPPPIYPAVARRRGYEGTVVVEVLVNKEGRVQNLRLFQSSGYAVLDRAATTAIKTWLFEPGKAGDEKIEMWVKVPLRFQLR